MIYFGYIYIFLFIISHDSKVNRRANTFELMCTEDGEIKGWKWTEVESWLFTLLLWSVVIVFQLFVKFRG